MTIPTYDALMLPVLRRVAERLHTMRELTLVLSDELGLTQEERETLLPGGSGTTIASRVGWAKTHLKKAGLVEQPRLGTLVATQTGLNLLATNPEKIDLNLLRQYAGYNEFVKRAVPFVRAARSADEDAPEKPAEPSNGTPIELIQSSVNEINEVLRDELLLAIMARTPKSFENLIVKLMVAMKYGGARSESGMQLGGTGDEGVDGVIYEDQLGLDRVYLQAKRNGKGNTVGPDVVQAFVGALAGKGAVKGVLITTSSFTRQAIATASGLGNFRVVLIDGAELTRLMVRFNVGVRLDQTIEIKKVDYDFFDGVLEA